MSATNAFGLPLVAEEPPANTVTLICRLCSYMGPTCRVETSEEDLLETLANHVGQDHPDSTAAESSPKRVYGYVAGLTDETLARVNAERAVNPYGDGQQCTTPGCLCDS